MNDKPKLTSISADSFDWEDVAEWLAQIAIEGSDHFNDDIHEHLEETIEAIGDEAKDFLMDYLKRRKGV